MIPMAWVNPVETIVQDTLGKIILTGKQEESHIAMEEGQRHICTAYTIQWH